MFGISGLELMIIAVFVLVIFGPERLPELGRSFGKAMSMFKRAQQDMEHVIKAEMYAAEKPKAASAQDAASDEDSETPIEATSTPAAEIWASTDEGSDDDDDDEEDEE